MKNLGHAASSIRRCAHTFTLCKHWKDIKSGVLKIGFNDWSCHLYHMKTLLYTGCHSNKSAQAPGCTVVLHWRRNRMGAVPIHTAGCSDKGAVLGSISCCAALLQPLLRNRCGTGSYISSGLVLGFQRAKLLSKYKATEYLS